jgi:hypothetical protein
MRTCFVCAALAFFATILPGQPQSVPISGPWRFSTVDHPDHARTGFLDASWALIRSGSSWERQGFDKLDGHMWYRARVTIPSTLRDEAEIKGAIRLELGMIDDIDQTFLNGVLIGVNGTDVPPGTQADTGSLAPIGSKWNTARSYTIPSDDPRIRWDAENVIAIRVYDSGGPGGLWSGDPRFRPLSLSDVLVIGHAEAPFREIDGGFEKTIDLYNRSSSIQIRGSLVIRVVDGMNGSELSRSTRPLLLAPGMTSPVTERLSRPNTSTLIVYQATVDGFERSVVSQDEVPYVLTPLPNDAPRINGPSVVGARPDRPFVFRIPVSGERPMQYKVDGLPNGLAVNQRTGIITGRTPERGVYAIQMHAQNAHGRDERVITLNVGDKLALTPPMGWNSWNVWGLAVDQEKVIASALVFEEKGLADHGWSFINIDDGWEIKGDDPRPKRHPDGSIVVNEKFPDMKALGDSLHALGLKFGIYSSPGPLTCGGYTASYGYEMNDARSYASWGIDYLKYDWCSYGNHAKDNSRAELMKPYGLMRSKLDSVDRDIVYSLCQYGMGNVWEWGAEVGGDLWRTTGDIIDTWESMSGIGFNQVANARFAGPGHWNDPDMLVVGWVGWGPRLHPARLTPDEQYTHISLWCLLSAPLLIGCDLTRLDAFTLNLLTNDEVLAIDQDPLGRQATPKLVLDSIQVWTKPLANGSTAIGVFNLSAAARSVTVDLKEIGLSDRVVLRDLWRQRSLGEFTRSATFDIPRHGVVLLRTQDR